MAWYVVSYDLRREIGPGAYIQLFAALSTAVDYCKPLQSVWIIQTSKVPSEIIRILLDVSVLDDDDGIVVLEITGRGDFRRVINRDVADWLNTHLTRV